MAPWTMPSPCCAGDLSVAPHRPRISGAPGLAARAPAAAPSPPCSAVIRHRDKNETKSVKLRRKRRIEAWRPGQQLIEVSVDGQVAFTAGVLERFDIKQMDVSAPVPDQSGLLQPAGDHCDAAALHAQHLREKFLGERQTVAPEQVASLKQPSGELSKRPLTRLSPLFLRSGARRKERPCWLRVFSQQPHPASEIRFVCSLLP